MASYPLSLELAPGWAAPLPYSGVREHLLVSIHQSVTCGDFRLVICILSAQHLQIISSSMSHILIPPAHKITISSLICIHLLQKMFPSGKSASWKCKALCWSGGSDGGPVDGVSSMDGPGWMEFSPGMAPRTSSVTFRHDLEYTSLRPYANLVPEPAAPPVNKSRLHLYHS